MKVLLLVLILAAATLAHAALVWDSFALTLTTYPGVNNEWGLVGPPPGVTRRYRALWIRRSSFSPGDLMEVRIQNGFRHYRVFQSRTWPGNIAEPVIGGQLALDERALTGIPQLDLKPGDSLRVLVIRQAGGTMATVTIEAAWEDMPQ